MVNILKQLERLIYDVNLCVKWVLDKLLVLYTTSVTR